jgi:hypothetical protein
MKKEEKSGNKAIIPSAKYEEDMVRNQNLGSKNRMLKTTKEQYTDKTGTIRTRQVIHNPEEGNDTVWGIKPPDTAPIYKGTKKASSFFSGITQEGPRRDMNKDFESKKPSFFDDIKFNKK